MPTSPDDLLRGAGLRVTAPRVMVLRALAARPHVPADVVFETVRSEHGAVSAQGVYDVLRICTDAGIVRRIEPARAPALYELRVADNHHHLVCRVCGAVADVDCAVGSVPCLEPKDALGFDVDEAEVVYWGTCPACQKAREKKDSNARRRKGAAPQEKPQEMKERR
ncbi:MAG: Fur family transcriptional regulator, stress-responsive regulator [Acidimicrobiaceae bacterium]|jgi:Fur family ferric uptake transcriptional regulator